MSTPLKPILISCLIALFSAAAPSTAAADFKIGIDANLDLTTADATNLTPLVGATNASVFRTLASWSAIAPTKPAHPTDPNDPAYRWSWIDKAARIAASNNADTLLSVLHAPAWAEGPNRPTTGYGPTGTQAPFGGSWAPDPDALGAVATAIAKRYDGTTPDPLNPGSALPRIHLFEAWNEPELKRFLTPQCSRGAMQKNGSCSKRGRIVVTDNYRTMLNSFYAGVKLVQPDATVSIGGLAGGASSSEGPEIAPLRFLRALLCLSEGPVRGSLVAKDSASCPVKANFDAVSYHPYTLFGKPTTKSPTKDGLVLGDTPRLTSTVQFAVDNGTVIPAAPKEIWASEFDWLTCPPCAVSHSTGKLRGLPESTAAAYTSETFYRLWSWGVSKAVWFDLIDDLRWPAGGLYANSGGSLEPTPKLSLRALSFPVFSAKTKGGAFAWALSPCRSADDTVTFQVKSGSNWVDVASGSPGSDGSLRTETWAIPRRATLLKAIASGPSCEATTSLPVTIQPG